MSWHSRRGMWTGLAAGAAFSLVARFLADNHVLTGLFVVMTLTFMLASLAFSRDGMSIHAIYRACIWLPILVPAALIFIANAFGLRLAVGVVSEMIVYSLFWGGLPYAVLGVWATWWVGGRPELEIRRLMFRAPLLMVAVFVPLALLLGLAAGAPGPSTGVAVLGAVVIMILGYAYVGLTVFLRNSLGARQSAA